MAWEVWKHYYIGVDLGQKRDHTAVAVLEKAEVVFGERNRVSYERQREWRHSVRLLERMALGTPYTEVAERLIRIARSDEMKHRCTMVLDATGVGLPVVDLIKQKQPGCMVDAVVITGGDRCWQQEGVWRTPKKELIMGLVVMLETGRLKVARGLEEAGTLVKELQGLRVKMSEAGRESFGAWREGEHDDLVLAVALAGWRAHNRRFWGLAERPQV